MLPAAFDEVLHEPANVCGTFPKGRHVQVDDSQPIQQILPELPGGNHLVQIAIRGGDDPDIDPGLLAIGADRLYFAILQKPQEDRLHAQAHLADFVQEQRAAIRKLQKSRLVAVGARKAALDVSEELGLEERLGQAGTIDGHEGPRLPGRRRMDAARHEILADAALARDEDLGIAASRSVGHRQQFDHGLALDDHRGSGGERGRVQSSACKRSVHTCRS